MSGRWLFWGHVLAWLVTGSPASSQTLRVELEPEWRGTPLTPNRVLPSERWPGLSISRLDGLFSELALQRADGSWLQSEGWNVYWSLEGKRSSAVADGLPPVEFQAIRFRVGLNRELDASDPQQWPAGHALHPDVCGLHWGWRSGYVFFAVEGHWGAERETPGGFSYHLAGAETPMWVELPVKLSGARSATLHLGLDMASVLNGGDVLADFTSTHSRTGDTFANTLKGRVSRAFRVKGLQADLYQALPGASPGSKGPVASTTPFALRISERLPKVQMPPDNPLTQEGVELGRRLFHETKLSRNAGQSCASCHDRAKSFTDGRLSSVGAEGQTGRRNAMPLVNLAWAREFFWDGRAKSIREQVLLPIQDAHEMNESLERVLAKLAATSDYALLFRRAFGSEEITSQKVALALEQYLLTLISQESKFDRVARNLATLTPEEQRGLQLFVTENDPKRGLRGADCFHCHGGNLFSNQQFMNNGLEERAGDLGRMEVTHLDSDQGKFKVPTLRNVALTAPYMHDGRFATLEQVVEHYNSGVRRSRTLDPNLAKHPEAGLGLSSEDKAALVAFLRTLTDEQFVADSPAAGGHQISKAY